MTAKTPAKKDNRRSAIAQIHIAKKQLGMDDDSYRQLLSDTTGKTSCSQLQIGELYQVLAMLKKCGFKARKPSHGKRPNPGASKAALMSKIEAQLADSGKHWNYAHAMAQRMFKVEKVDWCDARQLRKIVAALEYNTRRG
jgi:phage gp16-like protein